MAEVIDLDRLVPDDIEFRYRGESYTFPGDPHQGQLLQLLGHYKDLLGLGVATLGEGDEMVAPDEAAEAELERIGNEMRASLLSIFQEADPKMRELPFGIHSTQHVVGAIFRRLGILTDVEDERPAERAAKSPRKRTSRA